MKKRIFFTKSINIVAADDTVGTKEAQDEEAFLYEHFYKLKNTLFYVFTCCVKKVTLLKT